MSSLKKFRELTSRVEKLEKKLNASYSSKKSRFFYALRKKSPKPVKTPPAFLVDSSTTSLVKTQLALTKFQVSIPLKDGKKVNLDALISHPACPNPLKSILSPTFLANCHLHYVMDNQGNKLGHSGDLATLLNARKPRKSLFLKIANMLPKKSSAVKEKLKLHSRKVKLHEDERNATPFRFVHLPASFRPSPYPTLEPVHARYGSSVSVIKPEEVYPYGPMSGYDFRRRETVAHQACKSFSALEDAFNDPNFDWDDPEIFGANGFLSPPDL